MPLFRWSGLCSDRHAEFSMWILDGCDHRALLNFVLPNAGRHSLYFLFFYFYYDVRHPFSKLNKNEIATAKLSTSFIRHILSTASRFILSARNYVISCIGCEQKKCLPALRKRFDVTTGINIRSCDAHSWRSIPNGRKSHALPMILMTDERL